MSIRIKNLEDLKAAYENAKTRYQKLLSGYRKIYKKYYPEEFEKLKEMHEKGELPQYTYQERSTSAHAMKRYLKGKEYYGDLPANWYDPINLRYQDPDFYDKFNYYGWEDFTNRPPFPHFDMDEATSKALREMAELVEFLHSFEWVTNDCKAYRFGDFGLAYEYDVSDELPRYIDSRTVHYEHEDIIITDPCYILRKEDITDDDWSACEYGSAMEKLGNFFTLDKYATADTIFGDWGCTTYNTDTKEEIGGFCADAGLVSVFSLAQVKAYNPDYDPTERTWCVTLIKDFTGDITLTVKFDEESSELTRYVEGKGSINFIGTQTSI